jgi:DtxR family transcriptional regulator, manganese transport regulator
MKRQGSKPGCILQPRLHNETRGDTACGGASESDLAITKSGKEPPSAPAGLAAEPAQADRFIKVRSARSASLLEDYTELIADLIAANGEARTTDIARRMGVAHPTASKTIARLKREGLARAKPYRGVFLTESGAAMAKRARERHRLVVDLLIAVGAPREAAEADAEGIEHYVSAATLSAFEAFLRSRGGS